VSDNSVEYYTKRFGIICFIAMWGAGENWTIREQDKCRVTSAGNEIYENSKIHTARLQKKPMKIFNQGLKLSQL